MPNDYLLALSAIWLLKLAPGSLRIMKKKKFKLFAKKVHAGVAAERGNVKGSNVERSDSQ